MGVMLRPMSMGVPQKLAAVAVVLTLSACGSASAALSAGVGDSTKDRLLTAADAAAKGNSGEAKHVEAVKTTRGKAADLTGHSNLDQSEAVWVVQVSGDRYICGACSMPSGASAPQGYYITMVLRASDFVSTDGGLGPRATDLSALGDVQVLRDHG
jgi:hypothetical protein